MSIYTIQLETISGETIAMNAYQNKTILVVNTASKCGFTPQFEALETLYKRYQSQGFVVLGFPCNQFLRQDPKTEAEIAEFCQVNYGVTFPMFKKTNVKGRHKHPLFDYLIKHSPNLNQKPVKWNFEKFLINASGQIVKRYRSKETPAMIEPDIITLLEGTA